MKECKARAILIAGARSPAARLTAALESGGMQCDRVGTWREAVWPQRTSACGALILSAEDSEADVGEMIAGLRDHMPDTPLVVITSQGDAGTTRSALRGGAWDCVESSADERLLAQRLVDSIVSFASAREVEPCEPAADDDPEPTASEHRVFLDGLTHLRSLCRRQGKPLAIMMLDLDHFRRCNERYSTVFGDYVLRWFSDNIRSVCRSSDLLARYECDRFIVAMPNAKVQHALELGERCRKAMSGLPAVWKGETHEMTVSVGIAESTVGFMETEHQLIKRAQISLEHAKREGANRTVTWGELIGAEATPKSLDLSGIDRVSNWVGRVREELRCAYLESTRALVAAVETKDPFAMAHSLRVSNYAETIAKRMSLPATLVDTIRTAAFLHDVGKIGIPDAILTKPGGLTAREYEIVKLHPATAMDILGHVSFLSDELPLVLHHHERHDGRGYPSGMVGNETPLGARVIAVADAVEVMFASRSYKRPFDLPRVRGELVEGSGRQFDPAVAEAALDWLDETPPEKDEG